MSYQAPQQPPASKRRKWPWALAAIVVLIVIITLSTKGGGDDKKDSTASDAPTSQAGGATANDAGAKPAPKSQAQENASGKGTVVYEVTGDSGTAGDITYFGEDGNQSQETDANLPWKSKVFSKKKVTFKSVTAQNGGEGAIHCKIIVDGKVQTENTSNGQYAVVSCEGKLF